MSQTFARRELQRGFGTGDRPVAQVLWDRDAKGKDVATGAIGNHDPQRPSVDYRRYYDPAFAELEYQKLWLKSWLYACREEDIVAVGDRVEFKVGRLSFFIVRSDADKVQAFYNSCIHRGTALCAKSGSGATIRCPYHGWEWNLDGSLKFIPSHWDFRDVTKRNGSLHEVAVGRWGGFVFINADPRATPFDSALGPIPEHFASFGYEKRYTAAHFRKLLGANWKVTQEAFMESYHVFATHPEAVPYNGDSQTQYEIWASEFSHVARQVTPSAVPSMHAPPDATTVAAAHAYAFIAQAWHYPDAALPEIDPSRDARAQIAQWHRDVQARYFGANHANTTDAVMVDSLLYFAFPNFTFWLSETIPFTYQFTPHPTDTEKCYFEVRLLRRCKDGAPRPAAAPCIDIGEDEKISDKAPAFHFLAQVFDQDMANMPRVQRGMRAGEPAQQLSRLGSYQECIMQHWHDVLDQRFAR